MEISNNLEKALEQFLIKMIDDCFPDNSFNGESEYIDIKSLDWDKPIWRKDTNEKHYK